MRRMIVGLAILTGAAFTGAPVGAHDHHVPEASLLVGSDAIQEGRLYHYWWTNRVDEDECVTIDSLGPRSFPEEASLREAPDDPVRILIGKRQKPQLNLHAWPALDPATGKVLGPGEDVQYTLTRRLVDGRRAGWKVKFEPPYVGDNYVEMFARWPDFEECRGSQGGYWTFHLQDVSGP